MTNQQIEHAGKIRKALTNWYQKNHRDLPWRDTRDPYRVWASEIMLQQTQVNTVIPYYHRFLLAFPDIQQLAVADLQDVLRQWEGLGYYARARNFHKAAQAVVAQHNGRVPEDATAFKALPGVGDYIAAAVMSIAFDHPLAVVDGNVKRVLARLFQIDAPVNVSASYKVFKEIAGKLLDVDSPGTFNQSVMELGALICTPATPDCAVCPASKWCRALKEGQVAAFPVKRQKSPTPHYNMAVGVVCKGSRVLIVRRPEEKMLGGLWEFPGGRIAENETPEAACLRIIGEKVGLQAAVKTKLTQIDHAYTHFKITADIFICQWITGRVRRNGPTAHAWVTPDTLSNYPFPKSNHKFMSELIRCRI